MPLHWSWLASLHSFIHCLMIRASYSSVHLTNNNGMAIGQRQSRNSGKHQEVSIIKRKDVIWNYARFTGVVFLSWEWSNELGKLSWELSDELGKLPKGMASPGRLRTHQNKRSVNGSPFLQSPTLAYGCFQKVVQSKSILWTNSFIVWIEAVE